MAGKEACGAAWRGLQAPAEAVLEAAERMCDAWGRRGGAGGRDAESDAGTEGEAGRDSQSQGVVVWRGLAWERGLPGPWDAMGTGVGLL